MPSLKAMLLVSWCFFEVNIFQMTKNTLGLYWISAIIEVIFVIGYHNLLDL